MLKPFQKFRPALSKAKKIFNRLRFSSSKERVIKNLLALDIPVSMVVDVGVCEQTIELITLFPKLKHLLFEPVREFHPAISKNYQSINYDLFPVALSNSSGTLFLNEVSVKHDGIISHSYIVNSQTAVDGKKIINSIPIGVKSLNEYCDLLINNYLLKIDVDGVEKLVIEGASNVLHKASVVIVEAPWDDFHERMKILHDNGFTLYDLADKCFYGTALWQVDLIYVNNRFSNVLRPSMNPYIPRLYSAL